MYEKKSGWGIHYNLNANLGKSLLSLPRILSSRKCIVSLNVRQLQNYTQVMRTRTHKSFRFLGCFPLNRWLSSSILFSTSHINETLSKQFVSPNHLQIWTFQIWLLKLYYLKSYWTKLSRKKIETKTLSFLFLSSETSSGLGGKTNEYFISEVLVRCCAVLVVFWLCSAVLCCAELCWVVLYWLCYGRMTPIVIQMVSICPWQFNP